MGSPALLVREPGAPPLPGPPLDLPQVDPGALPRQRQRIEIRPDPARIADPYADFPEWKPAAPKAAAPTISTPSTGDHYQSLPDWQPQAKQQQTPQGEINPGQAALGGAVSGATFGLAPALEGVAAASGQPAPETPTERASGAAASRPVVGALKLAHDSILKALGQDPGGLTGQITGSQGPAWDAYERGRQKALEEQQASQEQHPAAFLAGQIAGSLATPGFGAGAAGTVGARIGRGLIAGAAGGSLTGAGEAISEGVSAPEVAERAAIGGGIGAPLGGAVGGALGRRLVNPASAGQRAARTAQDLGAPIPKGLASDNPAVNASAAAVRSVPWFGARMGAMLDKTQEAAGQRVEGIAGQMAGGSVVDRATAGVNLRPAIQDVIDSNNGLIDQSFSSLRGMINPDKVARMARAKSPTLPRTKAVLQDIVDKRLASGDITPVGGFEDIDRLSTYGATFNGLQRARHLLGKPLPWGTANPGMTVGDRKRLYAAMTGDLYDLVRAPGIRKRGVNVGDVDAELRRANTVASQTIKHNEELQRIADIRSDEGLAGSLIGAAKERTGNVAMLARLKATMRPDEFQLIGSSLLSELGQRQGNFSLAQFTTRWNQDISDGAKHALFSAQHLAHIDDIVNLGQKVKSSLRDTNTSHTSNTIILFDLARDALMLGIGIGTGAVSAAGAAGGAALAAPGVVFARWLSSPAKAAAMSAWSRAWFGLAKAPTNTARIASFNLATRNLSSTLGVPAERILNAAKMHAQTGADQQD
jgi:hypothetical protein